MAERLGRYVLERLIAVGGMGEVHLARQTGPSGFDRVCVVKTMHTELATQPEFVEMFLDEARLTARLTHPNIAQLYDFGLVDDTYYLAIERVDGVSLRDVVSAHSTRGEPVPVGAAARIVAQAAHALDYAHHLKGADGAPLRLVHRDISPSNLMLSKEGLVKVIDFGIAKARTTVGHTKMGAVRGKVAYMSPEQISGQPLDARSDVFALGLVLYELLAGRRAVQGTSDVERLRAARDGSYATLESVRPGLPPEVIGAVRRAMERDLARRFSTAGELAESLEHAIANGGLAEEASTARLVALALGSVQGPTTATPAWDEAHSDATELRDEPAGTGTAAQAATLPDAEPAEPRVTLADPESEPEPVAAAQPPSRRLRWPALAGVLALAVVLGAATLWQAPVLRGEKPVPAPPPVTLAAPPPVAASEPDIAQPVTAEPGEAPPAAEPLRLTAQLEVTSQPRLEVLVDGRAAGQTPQTFKLAVGSHRVAWRSTRLGLYRETVVRVGTRIPTLVDWQPRKGTIEVRATPPQVELDVAIDGQPLGSTPVPAATVWEGERTVTAVNRASGWRAERRVRVAPGASIKLKVNDGVGISVQ